MSHPPGVVNRWTVRFVGDDGTAVEGRLEVDEDAVVFRAGTRGSMVPAVVLSRDEIVSVRRLEHDLAHRVEVTMRDGRHIVIDNGLRPTGDLEESLRR